jgi:2-polyprenyl-3-methyl-5-hydroxy-6-metoxy-1,4-benzoquinol methylase
MTIVINLHKFEGITINIKNVKESFQNGRSNTTLMRIKQEIWSAALRFVLSTIEFNNVLDFGCGTGKIQ